MSVTAGMLVAAGCAGFAFARWAVRRSVNDRMSPPQLGHDHDEVDPRLLRPGLLTAARSVRRVV